LDSEYYNKDVKRFMLKVAGHNNSAIPSDWKRAKVVPIYKGYDRSLVTNYRLVSLTSLVCKQMEHVLAPYLRQVWDRNN